MLRSLLLVALHNIRRDVTYSLINVVGLTIDKDFGEQFEADEKRGIVYTSFSILAIVIACLGLFGLASFTNEVRTKEVGIRKVHGASVAKIVR